MKDCLKKRALDVRQARRIVHERSVWWGFVRGNALGIAYVDEPLTMRRCHSCEMPQPYEALEGWNSTCGQATEHKGENFFSSFLLSLVIYFRSFHGMMRVDPVVAGNGLSIIK